MIQSHKVLLLALLLVNILLVQCETRKSWKPAQPQDYLRQLHTPEMSQFQQTTKLAEETTRVTRSLDTTTTTNEGRTEPETEQPQDATEETVDFDDAEDTTTTTANVEDNDRIRRAVRLLVTGKEPDALVARDLIYRSFLQVVVKRIIGSKSLCRSSSYHS